MTDTPRVFLFMGKRPDELTREQLLELVDRLVDHHFPYMVCDKCQSVKNALRTLRELSE